MINYKSKYEILIFLGLLVMYYTNVLIYFSKIN